MKIGMGGHIYPLPPTGYGGVERVGAWWCDELTKRGHEVRIFGHPQSTCAHAGPIITCRADAARDDFGPKYQQHGADLDVIHHNSDAHPSPALWTTASGAERPFLHTVHAMVRHPQVPCPVFLSYNQARWFGMTDDHDFRVVHNGFPIERFTVQTEKEDFLLWCGSLRGCKAPEMAVQLAQDACERLLIIGPIQDAKYADYPQRFKPGMGPIEYLGEMGDERLDYFRRAKAFLYTCAPEWMEGMCLVLCEAMLSGTPVVGLVTDNNTIVKEVVEDGLGGVVCYSYEDLFRAIDRELFHACDPADCRQNGEEFSVTRTVDGYLELYHDLLKGVRW